MKRATSELWPRQHRRQWVPGRVGHPVTGCGTRVWRPAQWAGFRSMLGSDLGAGAEGAFPWKRMRKWAQGEEEGCSDLGWVLLRRLWNISVVQNCRNVGSSSCGSEWRDQKGIIKIRRKTRTLRQGQRNLGKESLLTSCQVIFGPRIGVPGLSPHSCFLLHRVSLDWNLLCLRQVR